jgi:hypothetical protein
VYGQKISGCFEEVLTTKEFVPRLCILVQFMYLYAPCRFHICDVIGLIATA